MKNEMDSKKKLIYIAVPTRLARDYESIQRQMDVVTSEGNAPLHPFQAFPYERYEGGPVGKAKTWEFCCRLVDIADEFYFFGVGRGTLHELAYAISKGKPIKFLMEEWDENWRAYYAEREPKIDLLDKLRNNICKM